jgi:para-nitrobenzyl esterase
VWIPGGGFMRGGASDPLYDGAAMARQGVVFVSINYRIGTDGFMQFDEAASNRGLQDQLAALAWVQDHIALFGGDPLRVTVAGVSAGAGAITHLMGLAQANTLFQQVILQSPSLQSHSLDDAQRIRHAMAGVLGTTPDLAGLAAVPLTALTQALLSFLGNEALKKQWGIRPKNFFPVRPVVDGQLLHAEPLAAIQQQLEHGAPRRPVLMGYNADEMNFFLVPNGDLDRIDLQRLEEFAADIGWPAGALDTCLAQMPKASPGEVLSRIQTDHYYRQPAVALEQLLRLAGCPTFLYEFGWQSPLHNGRMGAAHAMEIPFVLGNTASARAQEFIGALAPARLAGDMHATWAQFVLSGTPGLWPVDERGIHVFA